MTYRFLRSCVDWPMSKADELRDMIDEAVEITRGAFLKRVDTDELNGIAESLGYESHPKRGLTMAGDWHITYHRSRIGKNRVYYFRWSGIEHVFIKSNRSHL